MTQKTLASTPSALAQAISKSLPDHFDPATSIQGSRLTYAPGVASIDLAALSAAVMETEMGGEDDAAGPEPAASGGADGIRIEGTLASGGVGCIRIAQQLELDREVIVKSLLPGRRTVASIVALRREARIGALLEHPNIIPVYTAGDSEEDGPFIVMKRVRGSSWRERIKRLAPTSDRETLRAHINILLDICPAVEFAHHRGVLHRDLKPDNIMLGEFGEVYVIDWGTAYFRETDTPEMARELIGTPAYMAPEQANPDESATERTDVYLLGASLHEVLTGAPRHPAASLTDALSQSIRSPAYEYGPEVPPGLAELCNRACAAEPEHRHASVAAFRRALAEFLRTEDSRDSSARAREQLTSLESLIRSGAQEDATKAAIHRTFGNCRFGFEQALRQWPHNADAADGLRDALGVMFDYEVAQGHAATADALLAEMAAPTDEQRSRLARARAEREAQAAAGLELQQIRSDQRLIGRNWIRSAGGVFSAVASLFVGLPLGAMHRQGTGLGAIHAFYTFSITSLVCIGWLYVFRRHILDSERYWRLSQAVAVTIVLASIAALLGHFLGIDLPATLLMLSITGTATAVCLSLFVETLAWPAAAFSTCSAVLCVALPDYCIEATMAGAVFAGAWLAYLHRPQNPSADS